MDHPPDFFLTPCGDGSGYMFHSHERLCMLLGIAPPYSTCIAYAPYARNAPHCSRVINREKQGNVPALITNLLYSRVPSPQVDRLLQTLSTHAVCGINKWHQNKASEVYSAWRDAIWDKYALVNYLGPRSFGNDLLHRSTTTSYYDRGPSDRYTSLPSDLSWIQNPFPAQQEAPPSLRQPLPPSQPLPLSQPPQQPQPPQPPQPLQPPQPPQLPHLLQPPQPLQSPQPPQPPQPLQLSRRPQTHQVPQAVVYGEFQPQRPQPSQPPRPPRPPRGAIIVYRDPEVQSSTNSAREDAAPLSNPAPVGSRLALRSLDQNIAVSRASDRPSPSWSHEVIDTDTQSSASLRAESHRADPCRAESNNSSNQPGSDGGPASGDRARQATYDDQATGIPEETSEQVDDVGESEGEEEPVLIDAVVDEEHDSVESVDEEEPVFVDAAIETNVGESQSRDTSSEYESIAGDGRDGESATPDIPDSNAEASRDSNGPDATSTPVGPSPQQTLVSPKIGFRLYPQAPTPLSQLKQLFNTMTQTVSSGRRATGFIYAFKRHTLPGFLKIGYVQHSATTDPVSRRLLKWHNDCGHPVEEVFRTPIVCNAVERIESLVHLTLREYRRVENPPCERCERRRRSQRRLRAGRAKGGGRHDEWFEVDERTARQVVDQWALFAEQLPYERFGRLVDFWSEKVDGEKERAWHGDTVMNWLETMPRMVERMRSWEFGNIVRL